MKKAIVLIVAMALVVLAAGCVSSAPGEGDNAPDTAESAGGIGNAEDPAISVGTDIDISDWIGSYQSGEDEGISVFIGEDSCEVIMDGKTISVTPRGVYHLGFGTELQLTDSDGKTYHIVCFPDNTEDKRFDFGVTDADGSTVVTNVYLSGDSVIASKGA